MTTSKRAIYLHLGAHRTGTTSLQDTFRANRAMLKKENIISHRLHDFPDLRFGLIKARSPDPSTRNCSEEVKENSRVYYQKCFSKILDISREVPSVFFSYEGFLGDIYLDRTKTLYPYTDLFCKELMNCEELYNVKAGFCIRDYESFIISTYKFAVRNGYVISLEEYVSEIDIEKLSWVNVVTRLAETFGQNFMFWQFNTFKINSSFLLKRILSALVQDADALYEHMTLPNNHANSTGGAMSVEVQRAINLALSKFDKSEINISNLRTSINRHVANYLSKNEEEPLTLLDKKLSKILQQKYQDDLNLLSSKYGSFMLEHSGF